MESLHVKPTQHQQYTQGIQKINNASTWHRFPESGRPAYHCAGIPALPPQDALISVRPFSMTLESALASRTVAVRQPIVESVSKPAELGQNCPNPFNERIVISCQWSVVSEVRLVVYDILGREVAVLVNERKRPGRYEVEFDAGGLASGVYFYRLNAGAYVESWKMVLMK
jgi:hypothetical protein